MVYICFMYINKYYKLNITKLIEKLQLNVFGKILPYNYIT
jgi:hypothetical protein